MSSQISQIWSLEDFQKKAGDILEIFNNLMAFSNERDYTSFEHSKKSIKTKTDFEFFLLILFKRALGHSSIKPLKAYFDFMEEHQIKIMEFTNPLTKLVSNKALPFFSRNLNLLIEKNPDILGGDLLEPILKQLVNNQPDILLEIYSKKVLPMDYPQKKGGLIGLAIRVGKFKLAQSAIKENHPFIESNYKGMFNSYTSYISQKNEILELFRYFHEKGAKWNNDNEQDALKADQVQNQMMVSACMVSNFDFMKELLRQGVTLNDEKNRSLFHVALTQGNFESTSFLIENGVDVHRREHNELALLDLFLHHSHKTEREKINLFLPLLQKAGLDLEKEIQEISQSQHSHSFSESIWDILYEWRSVLEKERLMKITEESSLTKNSWKKKI